MDADLPDFRQCESIRFARATIGAGTERMVKLKGERRRSRSLSSCIILILRAGSLGGLALSLEPSLIPDARRSRRSVTSPARLLYLLP